MIKNWEDRRNLVFSHLVGKMKKWRDKKTHLFGQEEK